MRPRRAIHIYQTISAKRKYSAMFVSKSFLRAPLLLALTQFFSSVTFVTADNPIIQSIWTADPAPIVHNDRLYIFTSHDENTADYWYDMRDWRLFSTTDMVNYQHHAPPLSLTTFPWRTYDAFAGQVVARNNKFYYYVPMSNGGWDTFGIGVGVSDNIEGPYADAIGGPLVESYAGFDPTVFIDDDGQAYMYWGNSILYYVKLNADMISYSGDVQTVNQTYEGFGYGRWSGKTAFAEAGEGPWFYKRNNLYYMVYAAVCCPQNIQYSTAPGPLGPWTYRGIAMETGSDECQTNHVGLVNYKGVDYFFYHRRTISGNSYKRSVCVESFQYGADGSIPTIPMTDQGPNQIASFDPYTKVPASTMAFSQGVQDEVKDGKVILAYVNSGDYVKLAGVAFGTGAKSFTASVASANKGGKIEIRLDSLNGLVVGTCTVPGTGGWGTWTTVECPASNASGTHDLFFKFTGDGTDYLFNVDWWEFLQ